MGEINDRLLNELIGAVKDILRKEQGDQLRDIYIIGDIEKDTARSAIEKLRELANERNKPITIYINSAGGNVTDGLAIHDSIRHLARVNRPDRRRARSGGVGDSGTAGADERRCARNSRSG